MELAVNAHDFTLAADENSHVRADFLSLSLEQIRRHNDVTVVFPRLPCKGILQGTLKWHGGVHGIARSLSRHGRLRQYGEIEIPSILLL